MGCVTTVTPHLDKLEGLRSWSVDLQDPQRILTVDLAPSTPIESVQQALREAGYSGEVLPADH